MGQECVLCMFYGEMTMRNRYLPEIDVLGHSVPAYVPWSIQIELVQGCNRRCWFCGLLSLPEERKIGNQYMSLDLITKVFTELNEWLPKIRVEINSHGEPTLHPDIFACLRAMRKAMPSASLNLQTNTDLWYRDAENYIPRLFEAGLNVLALNAYEKGRYEWWKEELERIGQPYIDYYWNNPKQLSVNHYYPPSTQMVFLWDDLGSINTVKREALKTHPNKKLHNMGGSSNVKTISAKTKIPAKAVPMQRQCSKVFRELVLGWDGTVPICCEDWHDTFTMGNAAEENIKDIWYGERWYAARQLLFGKRRDLIMPCAKCDNLTTRPHLVEDLDLGLANEELLDIIRETEPTGRMPIALEWDGPFPPKETK